MGGGIDVEDLHNQDDRRLCYGSGSPSPSFYGGGPGSLQATLCRIPIGQSGARKRFFSVYSCLHLSLIPPILNTHLFTYRWCSVTSSNWQRRWITEKDERLNEVTDLARECQLLNGLNISVLCHNSPVIDLFDTDLCKWNRVVQAHTYVFPCLAPRLEKNESLMPEMEMQLVSLRETQF